MLSFAIAGGVLLGLSLYYGLHRLGKRLNWSMPKGVFAIALAAIFIVVSIAFLAFLIPCP